VFVFLETVFSKNSQVPTFHAEISMITLNIFECPKVGNEPQEVPGDKEEAGGATWSVNLEKMGNLGLQKAELPKLLCIIFCS